MPTYDYKCDACEHIVEVFQSMFDPDPACPNCEAQMQKVIAAPSVKMRQYLPLMEQEDGKLTGVTNRPSRNRYFESFEDVKNARAAKRKRK
jgi:putative FmdB family regulatory protein